METSGHGAIKENYFLDDGSYLAMLALTAFAKAKKKGSTISEYLASYHAPLEELEVRYKITAEDFRAYGQDLLEKFRDFAAKQPGWTIVEPNYEGIRVDCTDQDEDGWILVRMSLHEPVLPVNIESDAQGGAQKILGTFEDFLKDFTELKK